MEDEWVDHPNQRPEHPGGGTDADGREQAPHRHSVRGEECSDEDGVVSGGTKGPLEGYREDSVDEIAAGLGVNVDTVRVAEQVCDLGAPA